MSSIYYSEILKFLWEWGWPPNQILLMSQTSGTLDVSNVDFEYTKVNVTLTHCQQHLPSEIVNICT